MAMSSTTTGNRAMMSFTLPYGQFNSYVRSRFEDGSGDEDIEICPVEGVDHAFVVVAHFFDCEVTLASVRDPQAARLFMGLGTAYRTVLAMLPDADIRIGPAR